MRDAFGWIQRIKDINIKNAFDIISQNLRKLDSERVTYLETILRPTSALASSDSSRSVLPAIFYQTINNSGISDLPQRPVVSFAGFQVVDDVANNHTSIVARYSIVSDEGINLASTPELDFVGAGVTAINGLGKTIVNIPGITKIAGTSGAIGEDETWLVLAANSSNITGVTQTVVMTITGLPVGRYQFKCMLIYQTTALITGIDVSVNFTGTSTQRLAEHRYSGNGTSASTAEATEDAGGATGAIYESQGERVNNTLIGTGTISVDAADSDMMSIIEGFLVVSVGGNLEIKMAASAVGLICRAMQGSNIVLRKFS